MSKDGPREVARKRRPRLSAFASLACAAVAAAGAIALPAEAEAQEPAAWRDILEMAPEWCRADAACPLHGTPRCPATAEATV